MFKNIGSSADHARIARGGDGMRSNKSRRISPAEEHPNILSPRTGRADITVED